MASQFSANPYRSHRITELVGDNAATPPNDVRVAGWVDRKRAHGALLFVDVRDETGTVQCVVDRSAPCFEACLEMSEESVVTICGQLVARPPSTTNSKSRTGGVEIVVASVAVLSRAESLPFAMHGAAPIPEPLRLKHRFLDLRRHQVRKLINLRCQVVEHLRRAMGERGFVEVQTPILTASSPEGARDFLVPSRLHPRRFYALPQAPQVFKQLLMASGFERYFQIAPCFRDEDGRADRSPGEFYQLDIEMAFVTQEQIFETVEPVLADVFRRFGTLKFAEAPFPRLCHREALEAYGTDKPDLRNPLRFVNATGWSRRHALGSPAEGACFAMRVPGGDTHSRRAYERILEVLPDGGRPGLLLMGNTWRGSLARLSEPCLNELCEQVGAERGDAVLAIWLTTDDNDRPSPSWQSLATSLRTRLGRELGLVDESSYQLCWVVDYPMYERHSVTGKIQFSHNPFSMPQGGLDALNGNPLDVLAFQYDIVCNGVELSSGAIRNHCPRTLLKAFGIAGYTAAEVESRFGGLLRAFRLGAPPHGGLAPGIDRLLMLLAGVDNLRDVVAFPMTRQGEDLLLGAPSSVSAEQLADVHLSQALPIHPDENTAD